MSLVLPIYRAQAADGVHIAVARFLDALFYFPSFLEKLMLNKWTRGFLAAVLGLGLVGTSLAEERGTKDEAVAMTSAAKRRRHTAPKFAIRRKALPSPAMTWAC